MGFVGSARSNSEIITQWQPPLEEHHNGQILGYIIRYRLHGYNNSPWTIHNITSGVSFLVLLFRLMYVEKFCNFRINCLKYFNYNHSVL